MVKIIGLTGGIASGKSIVSTYLKEKGYAVLDADQVVHELQARGGRLYQILVDYFGQEILLPDQSLNRAKLGQLIFSNPEMLAVSNSLQDQVIRQELSTRLNKLSQRQQIIFLDIPLLFEKGYDSWCHETWLVMVQEPTQLKRLMARNAMPLEEAKSRLAAQLSLDEKKEKSQLLIDNDGSLANTYAQVDLALETLER
ncbi:dephospho-CoA kinase [Streptococcus sp. sy004]|uniref:dephospho-CoA kinase n=1 Tax=Streptococcus sp. sy004 TaxID=2600149 RepID=UPI0011B6973E|nr:dephospho-CoA kinase [Streptococcus sp. sy004]TWT12011.1 dephospho-CoA kinase [Streptococcus sp. sy004]